MVATGVGGAGVVGVGGGVEVLAIVGCGGGAAATGGIGDSETAAIGCAAETNAGRGFGIQNSTSFAVTSRHTGEVCEAGAAACGVAAGRLLFQNASMLATMSRQTSAVGAGDGV